MPAERSGQNMFDFQYGEDFGEHILSASTQTSRRCSSATTPTATPRKTASSWSKLKRLSDWLKQHDRKFLFELLVPAEDAQLQSVGGDTDRYDAELRPRADAPRDRRDPGRGHRGRHLEDRGRRRALRLRDARRAGPLGRSRRRRLRRARPRRRRRQGRRLARRRPRLSTASSASRSAARSGGTRSRPTSTARSSAPPAPRKIAENFLRFVKVYERAEGKTPVAS